MEYKSFAPNGVIHNIYLLFFTGEGRTVPVPVIVKDGEDTISYFR